ncbi:MAG TPA: hypothetical protein VLT36_12880 [Candidatus Dormibacteraeota bacterium]|nr:hypothetical protein [Candidatus Dormibacteraeota bacterium]
MEASGQTNEQGTERGGGFGLFRWVLGLGLALVLYVLSVAPAVKLCTGTSLAGPLTVFYLPLRVLHDRVPFVSRFYDWYFHLWGV